MPDSHRPPAVPHFDRVGGSGPSRPGPHRPPAGPQHPESGHPPHLPHTQGQAHVSLTRVEVPLLGVLGLVAFALGVHASHAPTPYGKVMDSLHLFTSGIPEHEEVGAGKDLIFARTIAPIVALYVTLRIVYGLYRDRIRRSWIRTYSGHTVVCGMGAKGLASAAAFRDSGARKVVGVDLAPPADAAGGKVKLLPGDATQAVTLKAAAIDGADELICACGQDDVNVAIATQAAAIRARDPGTPLTALVHVSDPDLAEHVRASALALAPLRVQVFSVHEVLARRLLEAGPLARQGSGLHSAPSLVVVGDGGLARAVVVGAARAWHLRAREAGLAGLLRLTVVGAGATRLCDHLRARYPALERTCELIAVDSSPGRDGARVLVDAIERERRADLVYLAESEESDNVRAAVALGRETLAGTARVIVVQSAYNAGFLRLFPTPWIGGGRLVIVRVGAEAYGRELLVNGAHEAIAHAIHDAYVRDRLASGPSPDRPALTKDWDDLTDEQKERNRAQADGIVAQLQSTWHRMTSLDDWDAELAEFRPEDVELMAELEHERWMDERQAAGWQYAPERSDRHRLHSDLVPWAQLGDDRREIDRAAVRAWPDILARAGYRVIRDPGRALAARILHEHYAAHDAETSEAPVEAKAWDAVSDDEQELNLSHADDIPLKLKSIGLRLAVNASARPALVLSSAEVERLSREEHERWTSERVALGWRFGPEKDAGARTHPGIVEWEELPEEERERDRVMIRAIPEILEATGLWAAPTHSRGDDTARGPS